MRRCVDRLICSSTSLTFCLFIAAPLRASNWLICLIVFVRNAAFISRLLLFSTVWYQTGLQRPGLVPCRADRFGAITYFSSLSRRRRNLLLGGLFSELLFFIFSFEAVFTASTSTSRFRFLTESLLFNFWLNDWFLPTDGPPPNLLGAPWCRTLEQVLDLLTLS